jgi:hypothetical protein
MELKPMFKAYQNTMETRLSTGITATQTTITVDDISKLPPVPTLLVIGGTHDYAETVLATASAGGGS